MKCRSLQDDCHMFKCSYSNSPARGQSPDGHCSFLLFAYFSFHTSINFFFVSKFFQIAVNKAHNENILLQGLQENHCMYIHRYIHGCNYSVCNVPRMCWFSEWSISESLTAYGWRESFHHCSLSLSRRAHDSDSQWPAYFLVMSFTNPSVTSNQYHQRPSSRFISTTARVLASQAEAIVRTGKHGHNIE